MTVRVLFVTARSAIRPIFLTYSANDVVLEERWTRDILLLVKSFYGQRFMASLRGRWYLPRLYSNGLCRVSLKAAQSPVLLLFSFDSAHHKRWTESAFFQMIIRSNVGNNLSIYCYDTFDNQLSSRVFNTHTERVCRLTALATSNDVYSLMDRMATIFTGASCVKIDCWLLRFSNVCYFRVT